MVKKVAVYGRYEGKVPVWQRYWKKRKDGVKQRYWKKTKRMKKERLSGRYEFHGTGRELYRAIVKAHHFVPKEFVGVSAREFAQHPEEYGYEGEWLDIDVES